jgi:hypothetical protein
MRVLDDRSTRELPGLEPEQAAAVGARSVGRPALYASSADKQKAYRARQKLAGLRVVQVTVRDVRQGQPLRSDVIDLSECREAR